MRWYISQTLAILSYLIDKKEKRFWNIRDFILKMEEVVDSIYWKF